MYSFGSFSDSATNMVDFMAFLDATREFAPNTANLVENAYKRAVRYSIGSDGFDYLTGMSILFPYTDTVAFLKNAPNQYNCYETLPNYTSLVEGYATMLSGSDYRFNVSAPEQLDNASASQAVFNGNLQSTVFIPSGSYVAAQDSEAEELPEEDVTAELPAVESQLTDVSGVNVGAVTPTVGSLFGAPTEEQATDSVYACSMTLSQDELNNLSMVEGYLYMDASDEEDTIFIEMGSMQNAGVDWETGEIVSNFDGNWPMLDEQLVVIYDQTITSTLRRSILTVKCNDVEGYLLLSFTAAHPDGLIVGFTQGFDENGIPVRGTTKLAPGDVITPTYPMLYEDEEGEMQEGTFDGDPITVGEDGTIPFGFTSLEGSETSYYYCFCLTDIFGETQLSDFITFAL
ncbi:MAG: hypothetical protein PHI98_11545 [Eubacteriales bacterium]|nr:hypothetical protein [Eubacteriales bacterium]